MTVLGIAEHRNGAVRDVSYELISAGISLAQQLDVEFDIAILGSDVDELVSSLNQEGVDTIYTIATGGSFNNAAYTQAITSLANHVEPDVLLAPHTVNGLDFAPSTAANLDIPLVTDVLSFDGDGETLSMTREEFGGKVAVDYEVEQRELFITLRPTEWDASVEAAGTAAVESFDAAIEIDGLRTTVTGYDSVAGGDIDISQADVLVSVGRGIDEEENLPLIHDLAESLGAVVSASRPIVDNGWLPHDRQVGQSGKTVTPDIYLAIGISGAVQHVTGMKGADTIIAINDDPNAPIFDIADYGIVGDLFEVVPILIAEFDG